MRLAAARTAATEARSALTPARVLVAATLAAGGFVALLFLIAATAEATRRGDFFGFGVTQEYELFGFTVYGDVERPLDLDIFNGFLLVAIAAASYLAGAVAARDRWSREIAFFIASAFGAGFLALDEVLSVHETLGENLRFLADIPGVSHADDAIFATYAIPAAIFVVAFRKVVASSRLSLALFAVGGALFLGSVFLDLTNLTSEERVEPLASLFLFLGYLAVAVPYLRRVGAENS